MQQQIPPYQQVRYCYKHVRMWIQVYLHESVPVFIDSLCNLCLAVAATCLQGIRQLHHLQLGERESTNEVDNLNSMKDSASLQMKDTPLLY